MTSHLKTSRKTLLLLSLVLGGFGLSLVGWRVAASRVANLPHNRPTGLAAVLNPDGSLKPGANGSFDVSGFRMEYSPSGAPRFVAAPPMTCDGWDTQFSFNDGVSNNVRALALSGTDIYVGGDFVAAGNVAANRVAKFDTLTNTWSVFGTGGGNGVNDSVRTLVVSGSDLYVGGSFTSANVGGTTVSANRVAKVNTTTGVWIALGTDGNGVNNQVSALALSGSDLYVGGTFTTANAGGSTLAANRVAKVNTTTGVWSVLGTDGNGVNSSVFTLVLNGSDLYMGGSFITANVGGSTVSVNRVARFDTLTNLWSALGTDGNGVDGAVNALLLSGSDLYVGGNFTTANVDGTSLSANRVAKLDTLSGTWSALGTGSGNGVNNQVFALAVSGSDLYVGGSFTTANVGGTTVSVNRVAKVNTATGVWNKLGTDGNGVDNNAFTVLLNGNDLYMGGSFITANVGGATVSANRVAKINIATSVWHNLGIGNGVKNAVLALAVKGTDVYVGGSFSSVGNNFAGNVAANGVAKFNTLTNTWSALGNGGGNGVNGFVQTLALVGNDLYAGGSFTTANVGGTTVNARFIARLNTTTGVWSALGADGDGVINNVIALTVSGSDLYVGGFFTSAIVDGTLLSTNRVAKFNTLTNTWSALGTGGGNGVSGQVNALAVNGSDLYVGGLFTTTNVGGITVSANRVAKVNITTGVWSALGTDGNGVGDSTVNALAVNGNDLYVGGDFLTANVGGTTVSANRVAKVNTTTGVWSALGTDGNGVSDSVRALTVSGNDLYLGGNFTTANVGGTIVSANRVAKFNLATGSWSGITDPGGGNGVSGGVSAQVLSGSDLFVGGGFIFAGDNKVSQNIGRYCGNSPPTITAVANTRQQNAPASTSTIAIASDFQQSADTLTITVNGDTSALVNGVRVSALSNPDGTISASIEASCTATTATFTLRATDSGNLFSEATLTVNVNVETTPPDTNIISMPVAVSDTNASFSFTGTDNCTVNSFECKLDNGNWTACTSSQSYSGLPVGAHTFQVQAKDTAGNIDLTPATYHWQVFIATCGTIVNPATLPQATLGKPFMQTLSASPTGSYTFSLFANTLPPGVSLVNTLGIYSLRGTPTASGTYSFTIKAKKNNSTCEGIRNYTMTIP